jgi:hypothetical protein
LTRPFRSRDHKLDRTTHQYIVKREGFLVASEAPCSRQHLSLRGRIICSALDCPKKSFDSKCCETQRNPSSRQSKVHAYDAMQRPLDISLDDQHSHKSNHNLDTPCFLTREGRNQLMYLSCNDLAMPVSASKTSRPPLRYFSRAVSACASTSYPYTSSTV